MEETRTRFCFSMPASRSASSKLINFCWCRPTPLVKKHSLGMKSSPLTISFSLLAVRAHLRARGACRANESRNYIVVGACEYKSGGFSTARVKNFSRSRTRGRMRSRSCVRLFRGHSAGLVFLGQVSDPRKENLDRLGLLGVGEPVQQLFGQRDRLGELPGADELLDADFHFLALFNFGVL